MVDPTLLALGLAVAAAVVVGGLRMLRARIVRADDRRRVAYHAEVGPERQAWARERGWQYVTGPAPVAFDGLEPPGSRAPVEVTHALLGAAGGRPVAVMTRSGEYFSSGSSSWLEWRSQVVELGLRSSGGGGAGVPPVLLMLNGQHYAGVMPGLVRERADMALVRGPLGLPWLLAAPRGYEGAVTTALTGVLHADVPDGVVVAVDGAKVVVAAPGIGSRAEMVRLLDVAEQVAQALEAL